MSRNFEAEKVSGNSGDSVFLVIMLLLVGLGVSFLFTASYSYGERAFGDALYFLKKQLVFILIGVVCAFVVSKVSLKYLRMSIPFLLIGSFILVLLTFVPGIGAKILGAQRWLVILGISIQPSELVKLTLVLYLAHIFSKKEEKMHDAINTVLPPMIVVIVFVFLVYMQNDFSTSVFIFAVSMIMFYIAGTNLLYFIPFGVLSALVGGIILFTKPHRVERLMTFFNPQLDPTGSGFQILGSQMALSEGGLWGKGLGQGTVKLTRLPEAHSDFVFAVLGEEMGFVGVLFILALFLVFAVRGYMVAFKCKDRFGYYLVFGVVSMIFLQALLNIAVVSGVVPSTGIPLPFFSSGGSAIIVNLIMCGIVVNVSRRISYEAGIGGEVVYG